MSKVVQAARRWISGDPDPGTRLELEQLIAAGDLDGLEARFGVGLTFGTAGIRAEVGAGPARMNRAVVIRTTAGLVSHLIAGNGEAHPGPVVVGFDARPTSRRFAEDAAGVFAAAGIPVIYFPEVTPTPLVAFAAKHLRAAAAVVITASHNPPADNGYKVYGEDASQIVPPTDTNIQLAIENAPAASDVPRIEDVFAGGSDLVRPAPHNIVDCYWEEVAANRTRASGSDLRIVYTPIHGVGRDLVTEVLGRAGHTDVIPVPEQAEPDGTFPTVSFPNPEEPGALDLALRLADTKNADLVIANDPDADRLAAVVPQGDGWRPLSGNEIGVMLADYILSHLEDPTRAIVASSIVSSPMLARIAADYGAMHALTLTGFKWIVRAGTQMESESKGRFVFGYEEALGYTIGGTVRDKDGISAALAFIDLVADLRDVGSSALDYLAGLWSRYGLWVSAQTSIVSKGPDGVGGLEAAIERLGDAPPSKIGGLSVTRVTDYRSDADSRPPWLGAQALIELQLGDSGRLLARPSGTEPKLKIYVDLVGSAGDDPFRQHRELVARAEGLGQGLAASLGLS